MAIGSGLAAQIGIANETVVNTAVPVTVFTEFNSESLDRRPNFAQGKGLRAGGLAPRAQRRIETSHDAGGTVSFDAPTKGFGKYMQAMMGSYSTTATVLTGSAYQQIHNLGSADGKTFTLQKGAPSVDGTVNPLTHSGCKVLDWTITAAANAIVTCDLTVDSMDIAPTGASALSLQTASYSASTSQWGFHQATVTQYATVSAVSGLWTPATPTSLGVIRSFSLKGGQPKDNTRWQAGSTVKAEALVNDFQPITGQIDIDFASMALYNQFAANTSSILQVNFTGSLIGGSNYFLLQYTMPAAFLEQGSTPKVSNAGIITVSYPFTALDDGTLGALQAQIVSTDTTV